VFSYDEGGTRYAALTEIQQPWVEIIESLQTMREQAVGKFMEFRKILPHRVIFFRDEVSEGEDNTVATAKLKAIQGKFKLIITCT
jgi:eukaryotic translation initiation factor 2C